MKLLKASEIAKAKHPNLPEHILASEERSGLWVSKQDIRVAKAQQELTDKEWVEWL